LKAGVSIVDGVAWLDLSDCVSKKRSAVHQEMVGIIRERNLSSADAIVAPIVYTLKGVHDAMRSNLGDYLVGGTFHPDSMSAAQLHVLKMCKMLNHNMPAEESFGRSDQSLRNLAQRRARWS
jgi:hypothetical protein